MTKVQYYSLPSPLHLLLLLLPLFLSSPGGIGGGDVSNFVAYAQSTSNINGVHTVYAGDQYADCTGLFCFWGPLGVPMVRTEKLYLTKIDAHSALIITSN